MRAKKTEFGGWKLYSEGSEKYETFKKVVEGYADDSVMDSTFKHVYNAMNAVLKDAYNEAVLEARNAIDSASGAVRDDGKVDCPYCNGGILEVTVQKAPKDYYKQEAPDYQDEDVYCKACNGVGTISPTTLMLELADVDTDSISNLVINLDLGNISVAKRVANVINQNIGEYAEKNRELSVDS